MNPLETIANQIANLEQRKEEIKAKIRARLGKAAILKDKKMDLCSQITANELQLSAYNYEYRIIDREHYNLTNLPKDQVYQLLVEAYGEAAAKKVLAMIKETPK